MICPRCTAPTTPHTLAGVVVCAHCGTLHQTEPRPLTLPEAEAGVTPARTTDWHALHLASDRAAQECRARTAAWRSDYMEDAQLSSSPSPSGDPTQ